MAESENKAGVFSKADRQFIEDNAGKLTAVQIAKELKRNPETISRYLRKNRLDAGQDENVLSQSQILKDFRKSDMYEVVRSELSEEEFQRFTNQWILFIEQFSCEGEVLTSERLELKELLMFEITKDRILQEERLLIDERSTYQAELGELLRRERDTLDKDEKEDKRMFMERIASLTASIEASRRTFANICEKSDKVRRALSDSRKQRTRDVEKAGTDFASLLKLYADYQHRRDAARSMEYIAKAEEAERERLSAYTKYADGVVDQPILNSESVKKQ